MDSRAELGHLLVPCFYLIVEGRGVFALARFAEQALLLSDDVVILGNRVQGSRGRSDYASLKKAAALGRLAANHLQLFEREDEHVEVSDVANDRLALAIDE